MNRKGFTLVELLVVVLIVGILVAMALPQYFKAVERSRMVEATTLMASIVKSQQRKYMQINKYTSKFSGLDVTPRGADARDTNNVCTKGRRDFSSWTSAETCGGSNGFLLVLAGDNFARQPSDGRVIAYRASGENGKYQYNLTRFYSTTGVMCEGNNKEGANLCADFCGVDTLNEGGACCTDGSVCREGGIVRNSTCDPTTGIL